MHGDDTNINAGVEPETYHQTLFEKFVETELTEKFQLVVLWESNFEVQQKSIPVSLVTMFKLSGIRCKVQDRFKILPICPQNCSP